MWTCRHPVYKPTCGGTLKNWAKYDMNMEWLCASAVQRGLSVEWGSHEPGDGTRKEFFIVEADIARHGCVFLLEGLGHALELGAHLDETVQLDAMRPASIGEATHHHFRKLGTQVVAHLCKSWVGQMWGGEELRERTTEWSTYIIFNTIKIWDTLLQLHATDTSRAVSVILLKQSSPPLHVLPQGWEAKHVHASCTRLVKHV